MHSRSYTVITTLVIFMGLYKEMEEQDANVPKKICADLNENEEQYIVIDPTEALVDINDRCEDSSAEQIQTTFDPLHMLTEDNKRKRKSVDSLELSIRKQTSEKKVARQTCHRTRNHNELHNVAANIENKTRKDNQLDSKRLFNKDNDGDTILHLTIIHNDETKTRILVTQMYTKTLDIFNKLRQTPLHLAVLTCQPTIVRYLVMYGANINVRDRNGQTPLHLASKNADMDSVNAIKEGLALRETYSGLNHDEINCNLKNYQGQTALHIAVLSGSREIAKKLLGMNANIDVQDGTSGRVPLHYAVEVHNINMVEFLLQNKANVNASTFSGNTPLHTAMGRQMDQIAQILLKHGAKINVKNVEGDTPLDVKVSRGWSTMGHIRRIKKIN